MSLAEGGHIGPQVVVPHFPGVVPVALAPGEEQHIGLDSLGVEDARGKPQDGVEIALVHQVQPDLFSVPVGKERVVRQDHSSPAAPFQGAVDVLEKVQLFVAGGEGQVVPGGPLPAFLGAKGRIGQHQVVVFEAFSQRELHIPMSRRYICLTDKPDDIAQSRQIHYM